MQPDLDADARRLFEYLAVCDYDAAAMAGAPADLIMGFGHFDPKIPRVCGALWCHHLAPRILFTGGRGAGTADLNQPEALHFRNELCRCYPEIPEDVVLVEPRSRHTGENVINSIALLRSVTPEACFERGVTHVILVANAYRQRRVWLTCRRHMPRVHFTNAPPPTSLGEELALFAGKGQDLIALMVGEVERLMKYSELGYIAMAQIPEDVYAAFQSLKQTLTR